MSNEHKAADAVSARRGFIGRMMAGAAGLLAVNPATRLLNAEPAVQGEEWMKALTAPHRTVFDVAAHRNGKPLQQIKNHLDGWRDGFKTPETQLNIVVGIHSDAPAFVLTDALWARFKIGQQYDITDGATKAPATQNVFTAAHAVTGGLVNAEQTIEAHQKRGVQFLVCMNTIMGLTRILVANGMGTSDEIKAAIMGGLLPGVRIVPAMNVCMTQLQELGVKYQKMA